MIIANQSPCFVVGLFDCLAVLSLFSPVQFVLFKRILGTRRIPNRTKRVRDRTRDNITQKGQIFKHPISHEPEEIHARFVYHNYALSLMLRPAI